MFKKFLGGGESMYVMNFVLGTLSIYKKHNEKTYHVLLAYNFL